MKCPKCDYEAKPGGMLPCRTPNHCECPACGHIIDYGLVKKPPLGAVPQVLWMEQRMQDLARAINDYISEGYYNEPNIQIWMDDLRNVMDVYLGR